MLYGVAIKNIGIDGVVEEHCVLRDDANDRTQRGGRQIPNVDTVDGNAARVNIVEPRQQTKTRRFAAAR